MKNYFVISIFSVIAFVAVADILDKDGKAARTGSPGEFDCTGCHTSFAVNSGPGSITISSPNLTNWQYVPGQVYQIDVTVAQTGVGLFGFGFEALRTSNNSNGGSFTITNSAQTGLKSATVSGTPRTNVVHKLNGGLSANSHTFSFNWTAPATNVGNIRFYTAGNAANNNNDSLNDYIYKTNQLVTPFPVGVSKIESSKKLRIYPNPVRESFTLQGVNDLAEFNYWIVDINGRTVAVPQKVENNLESTLQIQFPDNLETGIYYLRIESADKNYCLKLLHRN